MTKFSLSVVIMAMVTTIVPTEGITLIQIGAVGS